MLVRESLSFERNKDPKKTLDLEHPILKLIDKAANLYGFAEPSIRDNLSIKEVRKILLKHFSSIEKIVKIAPNFGAKLDPYDIFHIIINSEFPSDDKHTFYQWQYYAIQYGAPELVRQNLDKIEIDPMSKYGNLILIVALSQGYLDIAKKLMDNPGFKQNTKNEFTDIIFPSFENLDSLKFVLNHPKIKTTPHKLEKYRDSDINSGSQNLLRSGSLNYLNSFIDKLKIK